MREGLDHLAYILAGIRNRPGRTLATAFCFAFIAANIFSGLYLAGSAAGSVDQGISRMGADLLVVPAQYLVFLRGAGPDNTIALILIEPSPYRMKTAFMDSVGAVQGVSRLSPQLSLGTIEVPALSAAPVDLMAIDPETDFTIMPWLQRPLNRLPQGEVLAGSDLAGEVGALVPIAGRTFTIAGKLDPTWSAADHTLFLRLDDAYALTDTLIPVTGSRIVPGEVSAALVKTAPEEDPAAVAVRIRRLFPATSIAVIARHSSLDPATAEVRGIPGFMNGIAMVVVVAAFPLIGLVSAMVTHERQQEIGLLRAMGAGKKRVFMLVLAEPLLLAIVGGISGVAASLAGILLLGSSGALDGALPVSLRMPSPADTGTMAAIAIVSVVAISIIASLYPVYRCSMMKPYDAIRSGE